MQITWFGHATFRLDFGGKAVLIDPFLTGNPVFTGDRAEAIKNVSHVLITHGHFDHVGDTLDIAKANKATVTANYDLGMWLVSKGLPMEQFNPMSIGGTTDLDGFSVSMVRAEHGSGHMDGDVSVYLGPAAGIIVTAPGEPTVYHLGDTDVYSDMALTAELFAPKVAIVPIGDRVTMGAKGAALAVNRFLKVDTVVPCHYGSFPFIAPNADKFLAEMKGHPAKVIVADVGKPFKV
ncbi:MAG TPA: metal-dependent hydrolase [Xanthobacteraceae bacterium]|jgi:L-ascorbate metabolism protein UlaG (beta-lactamase superfamily)|nr:metal-dependent hydrolase [Xanthobacteraceae bacterium]